MNDRIDAVYRLLWLFLLALLGALDHSLDSLVLHHCLKLVRAYGGTQLRVDLPLHGCVARLRSLLYLISTFDRLGGSRRDLAENVDAVTLSRVWRDLLVVLRREGEPRRLVQLLNDSRPAEPLLWRLAVGHHDYRPQRLVLQEYLAAEGCVVGLAGVAFVRVLLTDHLELGGELLVVAEELLLELVGRLLLPLSHEADAARL